MGVEVVFRGGVFVPLGEPVGIREGDVWNAEPPRSALKAFREIQTASREILGDRPMPDVPFDRASVYEDDR